MVWGKNSWKEAILYCRRRQWRQNLVNQMFKSLSIQIFKSSNVQMVKWSNVFRTNLQNQAGQIFWCFNGFSSIVQNISSKIYYCVWANFPMFKTLWVKCSMFIQYLEHFFIPQGRRDPETGWDLSMNRNIFPLSWEIQPNSNLYEPSFLPGILLAWADVTLLSFKRSAFDIKEHTDGAFSNIWSSDHFTSLGI